MRENFLHFLWRWKRFDARDLASSQGEPIEIIHPGEQNSDAGPDFFNARIRIGDTLWAGNVEIHLRASDWLAHKHQNDPAYNNVVLHVVMEEDQRLFRASGERMPCLELRDRIPPKLLENYLRLEHERAMIPCHASYREVPEIVKLNWLDRVLVERLERKTEAISAIVENTNNHWEEAFYRMLARNFGLKVNAEPFELLAQSIPLTTLGKHKNSLFQIEALLFGQAGLLDAVFKDEYPQKLAKEYDFLRKKYNLQPISANQWKFLRLRPPNFPSIRIAQFAGLIHQSAHLFSKILEAKNARSLENLFNVQVSEYWETHFVFDKASVRRNKTTGRDFVHLLLINTIVPFTFYYGKVRELPDYCDQALRLLEELPPESNSILDVWKELGVKPVNAYQTQAFLQLKNYYCDAKRCLECGIGNAILR